MSMSSYEVDANGQDEVEYDRWRAHIQGLAEQELEEAAYEDNDPKSPGYYERVSDLEDMPSQPGTRSSDATTERRAG